MRTLVGSEEAPASRIASNVRSARERSGLSVVTLAKLSGVGRATLTNLEAGRGNPTIDTLYAVADALGASLGDLIGENRRTRIAIVRAGSGTQVRGAVSARLLDQVRDHGLAEIYDVGFTTTARLADPHPHGVLESLLLISGRLRTGPVADPVELDAGDFATFPGDVAHFYEAVGGPARGFLVMSHP